MTSAGASDFIGRRVREIRDSRGWTAAVLAERCAKVGAPHLTKPVITNIEGGRPGKDGIRRREVTVDEMLALALALEVPPFLLFVPLGQGDALQVTGTAEMSTLEAARWVAGCDEATEAEASVLSQFRTLEDRARWRVEWRRRCLPLALLSNIAESVNFFDIIVRMPGLEVPRELERLARETAPWIDRLAALGIKPPRLPARMVALMREQDMLELADPDELEGT